MKVTQPVCSSVVISDDGSEILLEYFVMNCICLSDGAEGIPSFGIRLQATTKGGTVETSVVQDISPAKEEITNLAKELCGLGVTPCTLKDVVEDYIALQI